MVISRLDVSKAAVLQAIQLTPYAHRSDIRTLAINIGIPKPTLLEYFKTGLFRRHSASLKPTLKKDNVNHVFNLLSAFHDVEGRFILDPMLDYVHMDEMTSVSVDRDVYRYMLLNNVLPAIKSSWSAQRYGTEVVVQQNNAKPHVLIDDSALWVAGSEDRWKIELRSQPTSYPDLSVLGLGFFPSSQSLRIKTNDRTATELVANIEQAFLKVCPTKIDKVFVTLQKFVEQAPHPTLTRSLLKDSDLLPLSLECSRDIVNRAHIAPS